MTTWLKLGILGLLAVAAAVAFTLLRPPAILIEQAEARSHGGALVGITMTIRNDGAPDLLVSAEVPGAKMAVVKGENAQPLPIPAYSTVSLAMDGAHVMIGGIPGEMAEGRLIPLLLTFAEAGEIAAKARFTAGMAMPMGEGDMGGAMDHGAMMGMDHVVPEGEPTPTLSLTATPREEGGLDLAIETTNFEFSRDQADGPHVPGTGHGHLYVGGVKLGRVYDNTAIIPPLPPGPQIVRVTLNTNDHRTYVVNGKTVTAAVTITQ